VTARSHLGRLGAAIALTAAALALLAAASAVRLPFHRSDTARVRLSWSARPERIERCRTLSAEELAQREEHMRQRVECEGAFATYALRIAVDDGVVSEAVVRGAGLRHDRPLYLLREFAVSPGIHRVRVTLSRRERSDSGAAAPAPTVSQEADTGLYAGRAQREVAERSRRAGAAIPSRLALDTSLVLVPRGVVLITLNAERRMLELHSAPR
jgi:hypothetical protein